MGIVPKTAVSDWIGLDVMSLDWVVERAACATHVAPHHGAWGIWIWTVFLALFHMYVIRTARANAPATRKHLHHATIGDLSELYPASPIVPYASHSIPPALPMFPPFA